MQHHWSLYIDENQILKQLRDVVVYMLVLWIESFKLCTEITLNGLPVNGSSVLPGYVNQTGYPKSNWTEWKYFVQEITKTSKQQKKAPLKERIVSAWRQTEGI